MSETGTRVILLGLLLLIALSCIIGILSDVIRVAR